jgi:hypothetical protein
MPTVSRSGVCELGILRIVMHVEGKSLRKDNGCINPKMIITRRSRMLEAPQLIRKPAYLFRFLYPGWRPLL